MSGECHCGGYVHDGFCTDCGADFGDGASGDYGSAAYSEQNIETVWELLAEVEEEDRALAALGVLDVRSISEVATATEVEVASGKSRQDTDSADARVDTPTPD